MPNTKTAKKRMRQNEERRLRNRARRTVLRTQLKKCRAAIDAKDIATAETEFRQVARKFDKAASAKVIHPNAAARVKSRLSAGIKSLKTAATARN